MEKIITCGNSFKVATPSSVFSKVPKYSTIKDAAANQLLEQWGKQEKVGVTVFSIKTHLYYLGSYNNGILLNKNLSSLASIGGVA